MIDEIDLHLHPRWQARILEDLVRIFPNVQVFVVGYGDVSARAAICAIWENGLDLFV